MMHQRFGVVNEQLSKGIAGLFQDSHANGDAVPARAFPSR
jgi:hypothetical protein